MNFYECEKCGAIPGVTACCTDNPREVQQWVSVEDRLPEKVSNNWPKVLAFWHTSEPDYEPGGMDASWFDGRHWQASNGEMDYHGSRRVTHWMPLPAPPQQ